MVMNPMGSQSVKKSPKKTNPSQPSNLPYICIAWSSIKLVIEQTPGIFNHQKLRPASRPFRSPSGFLWSHQGWRQLPYHRCKEGMASCLTLLLWACLRTPAEETAVQHGCGWTWIIGGNPGLWRFLILIGEWNFRANTAKVSNSDLFFDMKNTPKETCQVLSMFITEVGQCYSLKRFWYLFYLVVEPTHLKIWYIYI